MMEIKCYVCNTATDDWRSNLIGLKSQHSNRLITNLLRKVLNGFQSMRNIDNELNCICIDCLNKVEDYDWKCLQAKQSEKDLYNILIETENGFMIDSKPTSAEFASSSNFQTENVATVDIQSIIEPEMISVNEMFDVKPSYNNLDLIDEQTERHSSYEDIDEEDEELIAPTVRTPLEICNPIDVDEIGMKAKSNYECTDCRIVFERTNDLRAHNKHVHQRTPGRPRGSSKMSYECPDCRIVFERRNDLREHNKQVHHRTPGRPKKISSIEAKVKRSVGRPKKISETKTGAEYSSSSSRQQDTNALQTQDIVESETNAADEFYDHQLAIKEDPDYDNGGEKESGDDDIDQSDEDFVSSERKIDKGKPANTMERKRRVGRPRLYVDIKFECNKCELEFETAKALKDHKAWHRDQTFPKLKCKKCFYISDGQETFDAHDKLHENVPPLQCVFCDYYAPTKTRLNLHTVKHITVKQFICSICAMQFVRENIFKTHMNYHLNKRRYSCSKCPMTFIEKKNLNRHSKTHSGIKPYSCKICSRRFAHSYNVSKHERTHTERDVYRSFKCNIEGCKSGFDSKTKLNRHLQKNHSMIPHSAIANNLDEKMPMTTGRWAQRNAKIVENHNPDAESTNIHDDNN